MVLRALVIFCLWVTAASAQPTIGLSFPPVSTPAQLAFTQGAMNDLGLRHIRVAEAWERRGLQPTDADFAPLVRRLSALDAAGFDVLLTVELRAPEAACALSNEFACVIRADAPFEAYLAQLLRLVGPYIEAIQIGNEWDNRFPGTTAEFLAIHTRAASVIRANHPDLTLVLGGVTGRAGLSHALCFVGANPAIPGLDWPQMRRRFCVRGAWRNENLQAAVTAVLFVADYDVVDIHLYDAPGLWPDAVAWMAMHTDAPIWVTEFGGPSPEHEPSDPAYQATRLPAYLAMVDTLPVARAYYFKLTDDPASLHAASGLYDVEGAAKPALAVFSQWLRAR